MPTGNIESCASPRCLDSSVELLLLTQDFLVNKVHETVGRTAQAPGFPFQSVVATWAGAAKNCTFVLHSVSFPPAASCKFKTRLHVSGWQPSRLPSPSGSDCSPTARACSQCLLVKTTARGCVPFQSRLGLTLQRQPALPAVFLP